MSEPSCPVARALRVDISGGREEGSGEKVRWQKETAPLHCTSGGCGSAAPRGRSTVCYHCHVNGDGRQEHHATRGTLRAQVCA